MNLAPGTRREAILGADVGDHGREDRKVLPAVRPVRTRLSRRHVTWERALPVLTTLSLVGLWQFGSAVGTIPSSIPPPSAILRWLGPELTGGDLWGAIGQTLKQAVIGLAAGGAIGTIAGIVLVEVPLLGRLMQSLIEFLRPIPGIVYLPLLVLMFGAVPKTAIILVATAVLWPMLFQTMYGVRGVDSQLIDTGRIFGLGPWRRLVHVTAPSITPFIMTGIRLSVTVSLIVAISAELITGVPGLGWKLAQYQMGGNYPGVYGMVVLCGVLGLLANNGILAIEKRVLRWHVSYRGKVMP